MVYPVSDNIKVSFMPEEDSEIEISIINLAGQVIRPEKYYTLRGNHSLHLNVYNIEQGLYFLKCILNNKSHSITRFIK